MLGATLGGRYRIEELIGEVGRARVYRAGHTDTARRFVISVPLGEIAAAGETRAAFRRDATRASRLEHSNVVRAADVGETDEGLLYVVMEDVLGRDLRSIISLDSPLEPERVASLTRQLARGLQHAHDRDVVHGALRPESVIVVNDDGIESARLTDFGLSILADEGGVPPAYASPEQLSGEPADERSDLYSLGLVLYEMLAGCLPFEGDPHRAVSERAPPISRRAPDATVSPELERIALRLLATDPAARYPSAEAVLADLEGAATPPADAPLGFDLAIDEPEPVVARPTRRRARRDSGTDEMLALVKGRRRPLILAGVAAAVAAAGVITVVALRGGGHEVAPAAEPTAMVAEASPAATIAAAEPPAPEPPRPAEPPPAASPPAAQTAPPPPPAKSTPPAKIPAPAPAKPAPVPRPIDRSREPKAPAGAIAPAREPEATAPDPAPTSTPATGEMPAGETATGGEDVGARSGQGDALVREGTKLYLAGRRAEAKKKFQGALLLDSRSAAAHRGLGFVHQKLGDRAKARDHLRRYLELAPRARDADDIRQRLESLGE